MIATSVQQGPGHLDLYKISSIFNILRVGLLPLAMLVASGFLPGGKIFPLKKAGFIGIDQSGARLPRLGSDYR